MTYYGPNAELFGNIKLAIWHYQNPITDIEAFVSNVSLLFIVDIISLIINGILLRYFCQINAFKVLKQIQQEFWPAFAITECFVLVEVSKQRTQEYKFKVRKELFPRCIFLFHRYLSNYALEVVMI